MMSAKFTKQQVGIWRIDAEEVLFYCFLMAFSWKRGSRKYSAANCLLLAISPLPVAICRSDDYLY